MLLRLPPKPESDQKKTDFKMKKDIRPTSTNSARSNQSSMGFRNNKFELKEELQMM